MSATEAALAFAGVGSAVAVMTFAVTVVRGYGGLVDRLARIEAKLDANRAELERQNLEHRDHEHRIAEIERVGAMERIGALEGRRAPLHGH